MTPMEFVVRSEYPDAHQAKNEDNGEWYIVCNSKPPTRGRLTLGWGSTRSMAWINAANSVIANYPEAAKVKALVFEAEDISLFDMDELEVAGVD